MSVCFKLNVDFDRYGRQVTMAWTKCSKTFDLDFSKVGLLDISRLNETKRPDVAVLGRESRIILDGLKSQYFLEGELSVFY